MNGLDNQQCNDEGLRELALFAGAGGGILGGHLLGWRTVCAVEYNAYARSVLLARQNDGTLPPFPVWDDVRTFDGKPWRGLVDVVSGGFPCQDISAAGKGAGLEGERSGLWSEFARIISEVRPQRVLVENSPVLTSRGLGRVLGDLAEMGYDAKWGVISAADTGAPHRRERIWIVANSKLHWIQERWGASASEQETGEPRGILANEQSRSKQQERESMAYTMRQRQQGIIAGQLDAEEWKEPRKRPDRPRSYGFGWWPTEPGLGRVANGVANRADRIKAIGNGQVSRVVATAWRILSDEN